MEFKFFRMLYVHSFTNGLTESPQPLICSVTARHRVLGLNQLLTREHAIFNKFQFYIEKYLFSLSYGCQWLLFLKKTWHRTVQL